MLKLKLKLKKISTSLKSFATIKIKHMVMQNNFIQVFGKCVLKLTIFQLILLFLSITNYKVSPRRRITRILNVLIRCW